MPGPPPKRSDQRRRVNAQPIPVDKAPAGPVVIPPADPAWNAIAYRMYESLRDSGQSQFYEASDWMYALWTCDLMSKCADKPSAMMVMAVNSMLTSLMVTEADRRRCRIELERGSQVDEDAEASVTAIDAWSRKLSS